ncbi:MAG: MCE family protein [Deltaproteobacteria bacterium]|nr:MCE family protein [Deltaproteobacteria bacterium]
MSKQANKTAIGLFVVVALVLAVAAIVIFGSGKFFVEKEVYVVYFKGSVKGLRVGAPVVFRGVKVGEVTDISIYTNRAENYVIIPVMLQVEPDKFNAMGPDVEDTSRQQHIDDLIKIGLRAQLQMQSLVTGQLMINVDFYPDTQAKLIGKEGIDFGQDVLEIPAIETELQKIQQTLEDVPIGDLAISLQKSLSGIERFVNSEELTKSLHYFKQALRDARNLLQHVDQKIDPLFAQVDQTLLDAQKLLRDVDHQVDPLAASLKSTSDDADKLLRNVNKRIGPVQADLKKTTAKLRSALSSVESALDEADGMVSEDSEFRYQIDVFLRELTLAARSLRGFADYLERNPDALLRGKVSRTSGKESK